MKDFGVIEIHGKKLHITADDEVENQEVAMSMIGLKLGELLDIDIKIDEKSLKKLEDQNVS